MHTRNARKKKVLLLDRDWAQTAYLAVSLTKAGMDVTLVSTRPREPWGLGRYCRLIRAPHDIDDPLFLRDLLEKEPADVILPLCESTQMLLWDLPAELTTNVHPCTNPHQRKLLSDRRAMYEFVASVDVPAPELTNLLDETEIESAGQRLGLPMVLRGTQGFAGGQVRVATDLASAISAYRDLRDSSPEPPFAQAFVTGQRCLIGGLFDRGRMLQWFSQTTVEATWATGPSIRVQSVRDPRLTSYAQRLFEGLEWTGLACAEFMRDEAGEYYFLEINPRPWAAIQAAHCCGVPLLDMFADHILGKSPAIQIEFPRDKEVALFPQFIAARVRARRLGSWRDVSICLRSLANAPWRHPGLLLHFLRTIWWGARS
jgi:predicted ATP-grasp superfamily ATP-dependent carboligase